MSDAEAIESLGGSTVVARLLGQKRSAVTMWRTRDRVPPEYAIQFWRLCQERGVTWAPPGAEGLALVHAQPAEAAQ